MEGIWVVLVQNTTESISFLLKEKEKFLKRQDSFFILITYKSYNVEKDKPSPVVCLLGLPYWCSHSGSTAALIWRFK